MGIKKRFLSFKNRLLVIFFILMLIPLLVVGILSYRYYHESVWDSTKTTADQTILHLTKEIGQIFAVAEQFLEIGSYTVAERYLAERGDPYLNAKEILALMNLFRGKHRHDNDVKDIYLVGINGRGISEREGVFRLQTLFDAIPSLQRIKYGSQNAELIRFNRYDLSGYWSKPAWQLAALTDYHPAQGLGRYILDPIRKEILGLAVVEINSEKVNQICREQSKSGYLSFSVYDANGTVLFGEGDRKHLSDWQEIWEQSGQGVHGSFVHSLLGEDIFFVYDNSSQAGWRVIGQAKLDDMMAKANRIRNITAASVIGCLVFTMLLYAFISDRITKPLKTLQDKMHSAAQGDLEVRFHSTRHDEVADLGDSFNSMIARIQDLMQTTKREQENLKKAEFRALQAQINPHFLYNTLDAIIWMSQASRREELTEMVVALSRFFRLSLNNGKEIVTVGEEVDQVKNYLIIQRMRYNDILDFEFSVDPRLKRFSIIKLTLQPLVENAIYHGLKTKRGGGKIWIEGDYDEKAETVILTVRDNGAGMTPARLQEVLREMRGEEAASEHDEEGGYALRNVHERIRLSYGPAYGLDLESTLDAGTTVTMIFPSLEHTYA